MNLVRVSTRPILLTLAVCLAITSAEISARETPAQTASPAVVADTKSFDPAAATEAWLASVPREQREKSDAYFEGGYWLLLWNFLLVAAISVFLLESRISARLRDFAERAAKLRSIQVACYAIPYF